MSKYKNKKVMIDGMMFASRKEADRYRELKILEKAGMIRDLKTQEKFVLIPSQSIITGYTKTGNPKYKCIEKECAYIADFVYMDEHGQLHVEDVKGCKKGAAYNIYVIKRKLMLKVHGIRIEEI